MGGARNAGNDGATSRKRTRPTHNSQWSALRTALNFGSMALRCLLMLLLFPGVAAAQASEWWPELDVYWRPANRQRTFLEISSSADRDSPTRQDNIGLYQDYLNLPAGYLRGGFRYSFSPQGDFHESRLVAEGTYRTYGTDLVRLLSRTRTEFRWVNGEYSYRIRERLHLQRLSQMHHGPSWGPYVTFEAYYSSQYNTIISRVAGRIGTEALLGGPKSIDVYIARQNNLRGSPNFVNALGVTFKLSY